MFYIISFSGRDISVFDETFTKLLIIFFFFTGIHDQLKSIIWSWSFFFIILLSMEVCKVCWCTCFYLAVVFYRVVLNHPFCIYYYYFIINLIFSLYSPCCIFRFINSLVLEIHLILSFFMGGQIFAEPDFGSFLEQGFDHLQTLLSRIASFSNLFAYWRYCQKMLSFFFFFSFTIKVHLGCVYSGLVISRETFCFNELLWFEYFFCYLIM